MMYDSDVASSATFLSLTEVLRLSSLSKSTLYREMARGRFPRPYPISAGRVAWLKTDIDAWVEARKSIRAQISSQPLSAGGVRPC